MKKIILCAVVVLNLTLYSCNPEQVSEEILDTQACCGDDQPIPPPPPPPPGEK